MADGADSERDDRGRFATGNRGGPGGSRRRSFVLRRAAEEAITEEHVEAMVRKATRMGLEGNLAAIKLVLDRVCGKPVDAPTKPEPMEFRLPRLRTVEECNAAIDRLMDGLCEGAIDRANGKLMLDAIQARIRAIEATEFEQRIRALEQSTGT